MKKLANRIHAAMFLAALLFTLCPRALAAWAPPPPEKREPLDVITVMIYSAHEKDRDAIVDCIDFPGFYAEYTTRTDEDNPLSEPTFRQGLLNALSGSYSKKLDDVLKGLEGRDKYKFIKMFVKSYSQVEEQGNYRHITINAGDKADEQPEIFLSKSGDAWRVVWVEPFERLRGMFNDKQPAGEPAPSGQTTKRVPGSVLNPTGPALDTPAALALSAENRTPDQVLAVLLIGVDRKDWPLAISAFDVQGLRDNLVQDIPALDFLSAAKLEDVFAKVLSHSAQDFGAFLPEELDRLDGDEKALMVELTVRALSTTDISGATADITVQHPDDPDKTYAYKMNKTAAGWKIDVISVFDNILDKFLAQMDLY